METANSFASLLSHPPSKTVFQEDRTHHENILISETFVLL